MERNCDDDDGGGDHYQDVNLVVSPLLLPTTLLISSFSVLLTLMIFCCTTLYTHITHIKRIEYKVFICVLCTYIMNQSLKVVFMGNMTV